MQKFTPLQYIAIATANAYGLDKETWQTRLDWFDANIDPENIITLADKLDEAKEPILMEKAINAFNDALDRKPTGFLANFDATASGLQIMACLIGCHNTARAVNLIDTGNRENAYAIIGNEMGLDADTCKKPVMT